MIDAFVAMGKSHPPAGPTILRNDAGLSFLVTGSGSMRRIELDGLMLNLFVGNEAEGGPSNLWLRRHGVRGTEFTPLLGPRSPLRFVAGGDHLDAVGEWQGLRLRLQLRLAASTPAWFWHLLLENPGDEVQQVDLIYVQDLGLSAYAAIRTNEYYVSHYVDLCPLEHATRGWVVAARQNLKQAAGRHPWALIGSLGRGTAFATDALQVCSLEARAGSAPRGIANGLPSQRLQNEHALAAIQHEPLHLAPGAHGVLGFFGVVQADHPEASGSVDLGHVDAVLAHDEARPPVGPIDLQAPGGARRPSLFARTEMLPVLDLQDADFEAQFAPARRHEERVDGALLSFFHGEGAHVALHAKELRVLRPHGHILRSGGHLTPDEAALTSTVWMAGVFHSMLTQGHVSINRFLSTERGWLGQYRSRGQRLFVRLSDAWRQLGVPSAFEIEAGRCRWLYRHAHGLIEVTSNTHADRHAMDLQLRVVEGPALDVLVTHHVALGGDDGDSLGVPPTMRVDADGVFVGVPVGSDLAARFPAGGFHIEGLPGTRLDRVGGDELIYEDGLSRGEPFLCIGADAVVSFGLRITGRLVTTPASVTPALVTPRWTVAGAGPVVAAAAGLAEIVPWYLHNALVHYLAPRGLEQYSGGGWGTRDVCQGPLEMLLALDRPELVRELLLRVFAAQNADGDWPQWFMFFERERAIRAGDSHGDIVYWPLLGLARYLIASSDAALLDAQLPFHAAGEVRCDTGTVWQHVERALAVIKARRIQGTYLAAYGHGDWNDSLQPADPALRERLCSAWTVTLHHQTLGTLARALRQLGRTGQADAFDTEARAVLGDFQRLLVAGGTVTGYALFPPGQAPQLMLHPDDQLTGVRYSLLPMMHAIIDDMLSPAQAQAHLQLIEQHLLGPDGARLFDRPLPYRGGPERLFQRAESSAFFGREVGVMYMHAHLRYAEMLAHLGEAERFFDALCKAHPIGLRGRVPSASLRQANCYYSSSDAAFADRYEAAREYARVSQGSIALDGGWRVYSSGPGIAIGLFVGAFLGIRREASAVLVDPVLPQALDGLCAQVSLAGRVMQVTYRIGPRGHGPIRLLLDGRELPFTRDANPYRIGAARVLIGDLLPQGGSPPNRLEVELG